MSLALSAQSALLTTVNVVNRVQGGPRAATQRRATSVPGQRRRRSNAGEAIRGGRTPEMAGIFAGGEWRRWWCSGGCGNGATGRRGRGQGRGKREARGAAVRNPAWRRRQPSGAGVLAGAVARWWR